MIKETVGAKIRNALNLYKILVDQLPLHGYREEGKNHKKNVQKLVELSKLCEFVPEPKFKDPLPTLNYVKNHKEKTISIPYNKSLPIPDIALIQKAGYRIQYSM